MELDHSQQQFQVQTHTTNWIRDRSEAEISGDELEPALDDDREDLESPSTDPGDSENSHDTAWSEPGEAAWDREWSTGLTTIAWSHRIARGTVLFAIELDGSRVRVAGPKESPHPLDRPMSILAHSRAVVEAVAEHLRRVRSIAPLEVPGSWVEVPRLAASDGASVKIETTEVKTAYGRSPVFYRPVPPIWPLP